MEKSDVFGDSDMEAPEATLASPTTSSRPNLAFVEVVSKDVRENIHFSLHNEY